MSLQGPTPAASSQQPPPCSLLPHPAPWSRISGTFCGVCVVFLINTPPWHLCSMEPGSRVAGSWLLRHAEMPALVMLLMRTCRGFYAATALQERMICLGNWRCHPPGYKQCNWAANVSAPLTKPHNDHILTQISLYPIVGLRFETIPRTISFLRFGHTLKGPRFLVLCAFLGKNDYKRAKKKGTKRLKSIAIIF